MAAYIGDAVVGIYNWWKKKEPAKRVPIEQLAGITEKMLINGLNPVKL